MKTLVLGMELVGSTITREYCADPEVTKVTGCDTYAGKLIEAEKYVDSPKFDTAEGDRALMVLLVRVSGTKDGKETNISYDKVDFNEEEKRMTSMAKTTEYMAALIARMLGRGGNQTEGNTVAGSHNPRRTMRRAPRKPQGERRARHRDCHDDPDTIGYWYRLCLTIRGLRQP